MFVTRKKKNHYTDLFAILANENPNFMQFSNEQKLIYLLNPTTTAHVKIIGFYIIRSLELRLTKMEEV
jgi:hypothetical protein